MPNFWSSPNRDPKRAYRFLVTLPNFDGGATWYAKSATKPKFNVTNQEHKYINHTFNYPGRVTWDTVTVTLVDPVDPNAARQVAEILGASGYSIPASENANITTVNKKQATEALSTVTITQIGETDQDILEEWRLQQCWVEAASFSELSYESEDLSTVELTLRFDWAELTTYDTDGTRRVFFKQSEDGSAASN